MVSIGKILLHQGCLMDFFKVNKTVNTIKRECPRKPRGMTKLWHMLEKLISLIFHPEIPHDELINVVYFFCSDLLLFSRKFAKTVQDANP